MAAEPLAGVVPAAVDQDDAISKPGAIVQFTTASW